MDFFSACPQICLVMLCVELRSLVQNERPLPVPPSPSPVSTTQMFADVCSDGFINKLEGESMELKVKRLVSQMGRKNMSGNVNTAWSLVQP